MQHSIPGSFAVMQAPLSTLNGKSAMVVQESSDMLYLILPLGLVLPPSMSRFSPSNLTKQALWIKSRESVAPSSYLPLPYPLVAPGRLDIGFHFPFKNFSDVAIVAPLPSSPPVTIRMSPLEW